VLFEEGKVIPRDSAAAIKWYTLAAERGHQDAKQGIIRAQNYLAAALDKNIGAVVKIKSNTMGGDDSPKLNAPASELAVTDDKSSSSSSFGIWTLFGIIAGSVYFMVESKRHQREELRRREEREEVHKRLIPLIDIHRVALDRNLNKSIIKNDYGKIVADNRNRAQSEFFASTNLDPAVLGFEDTCDIVLRRLSDLKSQELKIGFDPYNLPTNGYDFEEWVADALIKFGWSAETTSGSGDQGLDVIAKKDGRTLGVQCKLYNAAVGNKAVQEAHSGKIYYGVDAVCVLSNTSYTKSARELAIATEVKLFSVEDIPYIFEKAFAKYA
jgi:restriction system protein